jgi:hypothetical protein
MVRVAEGQIGCTEKCTQRDQNFNSSFSAYSKFWVRGTRESTVV